MKSLVLIAVVALVIAGCSKPEAMPRPAEIGRYVVVHSPQTEKDVVLLDTATGKTWFEADQTSVKQEPPAWEPMLQLNTEADREAMAARYGVKPVNDAPTALQSSNWDTIKRVLR